MYFIRDFLKPDTPDQETSHSTKLAIDTYPMWRKQEMAELAQTNFCTTFVSWQKVEWKQKTKRDHTSQEYHYYGHEFAEAPSTQVPLATEADRQNMKYGQFNYKDENAYLPGFTRYENYNYPRLAAANRVLYTKITFDALKKYNPVSTR